MISLVVVDSVFFFNLTWLHKEFIMTSLLGKCLCVYKSELKMSSERTLVFIAKQSNNSKSVEVFEVKYDVISWWSSDTEELGIHIPVHYPPAIKFFIKDSHLTIFFWIYPTPEI